MNATKMRDSNMLPIHYTQLSQTKPYPSVFISPILFQSFQCFHTSYPKSIKPPSTPDIYSQIIMPIIITHTHTHTKLGQARTQCQERTTENVWSGLQMEILLMDNWSKLGFHIKRKLNFCVNITS